MSEQMKKAYDPTNHPSRHDSFLSTHSMARRASASTTDHCCVPTESDAKRSGSWNEMRMKGRVTRKRTGT